MASEAGIPILEADVEQRVAFAESMTMGQTIFEWAPGSSAETEISRLSLEILHYGHEDLLPGPKAEAAHG
jgi:chromosome partitioning protein